MSVCVCKWRLLLLGCLIRKWNAATKRQNLSAGSSFVLIQRRQTFVSFPHEVKSQSENEGVCVFKVFHVLASVRGHVEREGAVGGVESWLELKAASCLIMPVWHFKAASVGKSAARLITHRHTHTHTDLKTKWVFVCLLLGTCFVMRQGKHLKKPYRRSDPVGKKGFVKS